MALRSTTWGLLVAGSTLWASQAGAVALTNGNSITFGAYTVTVNDCSATECSSMQMTALASNDGFVISPTGPGPLLYANDSLSDVSVTFEVTTTAAILSQVLLQVSGGSTGTGVAKVDDSVFDGSYTYYYSGNATAGGPLSLMSLTDGPFSDVFITADISANGTGGTATINSFTESFIPEPASWSVLGVGLLAMLLPKRRRS